MTNEEAKIEFDYLVQERLGHVCGKDDPTPEQLANANAEAAAAIEKLAIRHKWLKG